jgi:hypothetical protein
METLKQMIGVSRYAVDQLINPDTITFAAGGIWNNDILLNGGIGTASQSDGSSALFKRFRSALRKNFTKVKAFMLVPKPWVG